MTPRRLTRLLSLALILCGALVAAAPGAGATRVRFEGSFARTFALGGADDLASRGWVWPVDPVQIVRRFEAPAHAYGPGHRGVDLGSVRAVRAPADGRVAFAGMVAGRPIVTIDHGDGLVTTLEPVTTSIAVGEVVARGSPVGDLDPSGHIGPGTLHFGVRRSGEYINPLRLLGGVPRAVLLPCC